MKELIQKLEAATEGSAEIDATIWELVTPGATREKSSYVHKASGRLCELDETRDGTGRLIIVPAYTTSLDAAMSLKPEGARVGELREWCTNPGWNDNKWGWTAGISQHPAYHLGKAPTPALALCIAALRARVGVGKANE